MSGSPYFCDYQTVNSDNSNYLQYFLNVERNSKNPWFKIRNSANFKMFTRLLLKRAMSPYEIEIPKEWNRPYFLYTLFCRGFIGVLDHPRFGVICQNSTLSGYGLYYQPTQQMFANPLWNESIITSIDGYDKSLPPSAFIQLMPDYTGVLDICETYAAKLAIASSSLDINILNSRLAYVGFAATKAGANSLYKAFDEMFEGKPLVIADEALKDADGSVPWQYFFNNLHNNYIANDIIDTMRAIMNDFESVIGLNNCNTDKKERQIVDEVNANNEEIQSLPDIIIESVKHGIESAKNLFGVEIKFKKKELKQDVNLSNNIPGSNNYTT